MAWNAGELDPGLNLNKEDFVDFTTISSEIYPDLQTHYSEVFSEWAKADAEKACVMRSVNNAFSPN